MDSKTSSYTSSLKENQNRKDKGDRSIFNGVNKRDNRDNRKVNLNQFLVISLF